MTGEDFMAACERAVETIRKLSPKDTGNLAWNAIRMERVDSNTVRIYVSEAIAPYMSFTNEPWISKRWGGKKNPNEGWFDKAAEAIAQELAGILKGELRLC